MGDLVQEARSLADRSAMTGEAGYVFATKAPAMLARLAAEVDRLRAECDRERERADRYVDVLMMAKQVCNRAVPCQFETTDEVYAFQVSVGPMRALRDGLRALDSDGDSEEKS